MTFSSPVSITAGTTYVAGYLAPNGHYSDTPSGFRSAVTNAPLTALANGRQRERPLRLQQHEHVPDQHLQRDQLLGRRPIRRTMKRHPPKRVAKAPFLILLTATAISIAACGGSSPSSKTTTVGYAQVAPHHVNARKAEERARAARREVVRAVAVHHPRPGTGSGEINDDNPGHADTGGHLSTITFHPCGLVSSSQAQAIVGGPVGKPVEAPLGPTCIYRSLRDGHVVTLTVEAANFTRIKQYLHGTRSAAVAGHTAYCGIYGQPTTFVPLGKGRVLDVTAPCALGLRFAATAVPRLSA